MWGGGGGGGGRRGGSGHLIILLRTSFLANFKSIFPEIRQSRDAPEVPDQQFPTLADCLRNYCQGYVWGCRGVFNLQRAGEAAGFREASLLVYS